MATPVDENALLSRLNFNLICPLCNCKMVQATLIPCGHSMCYECLNQAANRQAMACFSCGKKASSLVFEELVANFSLNLMAVIWNPDQPNPRALLDISKCRGCKNVLGKPVTLPCGHSTCITCARCDYGETLQSSCKYCGAYFGDEEIKVTNHNLTVVMECCLALVPRSEREKDEDGNRPAPRYFPPVLMPEQSRYNPWAFKPIVKTEPISLLYDDPDEKASSSAGPTVPAVERVSISVQTSPMHFPSPAPGISRSGSSSAGSSIPPALDLTVARPQQQQQQQPQPLVQPPPKRRLGSETSLSSSTTTRPAYTHGMDLSDPSRQLPVSPFEFIIESDGPGPSPGERLVSSGSDSLIFSSSSEHEDASTTSRKKPSTPPSRRRKPPVPRKKKVAQSTSKPSPPPPPHHTAKLPAASSTSIPSHRRAFDEEDPEVTAAFEPRFTPIATIPAPSIAPIPSTLRVSAPSSVASLRLDTADIQAAPSQDFLNMRNFGRAEFAKDVVLSVKQILHWVRHAIKTVNEDGLPPDDPKVQFLNYGIYAEGCDVIITTDNEDDEEDEEEATAAHH